MNYKPNKNSLSTSSRWLIWLTFFGLNLATLVAEARVKSTQTEQAKIFLGPDSDGDGLPDIEEIRFGSDPFLADTDSDGANDLAEYTAGTLPRDKTSYPIFLETDRNRQLLTGDLLRLRPLILRPFNLLTNITYETNDATELGGEPVIVTNQVVSTNFTTYQWSRDGIPLQGQTNSTVVLFGIDRARGGRYALETRLEASVQKAVGTRIDVLGVTEMQSLPQPAGDIIAWGREPGDPPVGILDAVTVSAGFVHAYALRMNGSLVGWGTNSVGQLKTPATLGPVRAVSSGAFHTVALPTNGQVVCWGNDQFGQLRIPPDLNEVTAVAAGHFHSLALRSDGTVVAWGDSSSGQCDVPSNLTHVVAIAAGGSHSMALKADGSLVCWGSNARGQSTPPLSLPAIARIAAGGAHSLALTTGGKVFAWGESAQRQTPVPRGLPPIIAIAASPNGSLAVTAAGRAVGWGTPSTLITASGSATNGVFLAAGFQAAYLIRPKPDLDQDGLDSDYELTIGTSPTVVDSDGDGLEDGIELRLGLNPLKADSDEDGSSDWAAVLQSSDSDRDGLTDAEELRLRLDPFNPDSDGDGATDGLELVAETQPLDSASFPLIRLNTREQQLLIGDTLVLRAVDLRPGAPVVLLTNTVPGVVVVDPETGESTTNAPTVVVVTNTPANPSSSFQWYHNGKRVSGQTNVSFVTLDVSTNEAGFYRLVATSGASTNTQASGDVLVTVFVPVRPALPSLREGSVVAWGDDTFGQSRVPLGLSNVVQVAGGLAHSLALQSDGRVVAWGSNVEGQSSIPLDLTNAVAIAAGSVHSMALTRDGRVLCWGDSSRGQGNVPSLLTHAVAIAAGALHSMALDDTGRVWAWGDSSWNQTNISGKSAQRIFAGYRLSGLIGSNGRLVTFGQPAIADIAAATAFAPGSETHAALFRNGGLQTFGALSVVPAGIIPSVAIASGEHFLAALKADGTVAVWGAPGRPVTNVPIRLSSVVSLAAGYGHILTVVAAGDLDEDKLSAVAERSLGTRVTASDSDRDGVEDGIEFRVGSNPLQADSDFDGLSDLLELRNGFDPLEAQEKSVGLLEIQPALRLDFFTLGGPGYRLQSSTNGEVWSDLRTNLFAPRGRWFLRETNLTAQTRFRLVSPSTNLTVTDPSSVIGTVRAWGNNEFNQTKVPLELKNIATLSAGTWHTLALLRDGSVQAWGDNTDGQSSVPTNLTGVIAVAGGGHHSLALLTNGLVSAWGRSNYGQSTPPVFANSVIAIAAGGDFSLALLEDGSVVAWGANYGRQMEIPTGLTGIKSIAAGWSHAAVVRNDGTVVCWGENRSGQCTVPLGLAGVVAVTAGDSHTVALLADGTVRVWGSNVEKQRTIPSGLNHVVEIHAGYNHTVARRQEGQLVTWGGSSEDSLQIQVGVESPIAFSAGGAHTVAFMDPIDTDGDGLDNRYELQLGTSPDLVDTDGDGLSDSGELRNGFNPLEPTEAPDASLNLQPAVRLRLFTLGNGVFRLESSSDLISWTQEGSQIEGINGYSFQILESPTESRFYRLIQVLPPR